MPITLHEATVARFQQMLPALDGLVTKAEGHCANKGSAVSSLTGARLCEDMWDFAKQVQQACHHSRGAIEGVRAGTFSPLPGDVSTEPADIRAQIAGTLDFLASVDADELEALADGAVEFRLGDFRLPFVAKNFLLGFSIPNFFFHVTTAYGILRNQGVKVGKMDYLMTPEFAAARG